MLFLAIEQIVWLVRVRVWEGSGFLFVQNPEGQKEAATASLKGLCIAEQRTYAKHKCIVVVFRQKT